MLINKIKSFINFIIETVEYCLYGLVRVIIAPFKAISIYKDYVAMKQYHESLGYVEINDSTHKHDNYQSQIDSLSRSIEDLAQGLSNRINTNHQQYMKSIEGLNPIILNPDTVTDRLDKLEKIAGKLEDFRGLKAKVNTVLSNSWDTYYLDKKTLDNKLLKIEKNLTKLKLADMDNKKDVLKKVRNLEDIQMSEISKLKEIENHLNEGILKEIRDLGHIEADRLGMEVAVEEKESIRDEKYKWKREQQLIEAKIKEQAIEDAIEW